MVPLARSEKVKFKYYIFNHVYACFLCLNLKIMTLPAEKETIFALHTIVFETFYALFSFKYENVLCTLSIVSDTIWALHQNVFNTIYALHIIVFRTFSALFTDILYRLEERNKRLQIQFCVAPKSSPETVKECTKHRKYNVV